MKGARNEYGDWGVWGNSADPVLGTSGPTGPTPAQGVSYPAPRIVDVKAPKPMWWTVTVSLNTNQSSSLPEANKTNLIDGADTFVKVEWGVGGSRHNAEIDVGKGVTFPLYGDRITVDGFIGGPDKLLTPNAPIFPRITATAAPGGGQAAPTTPLWRSFRSTQLLHGTSQFFNIPPFARRMNHTIAPLFPSVSGISPGRSFNFYYHQSTVIEAQYVYASTAVRNFPQWPADWLPIPPSAGRVEFVNFDPAEDIGHWYALFELAL